MFDLDEDVDIACRKVNIKWWRSGDMRVEGSQQFKKLEAVQRFLIGAAQDLFSTGFQREIVLNIQIVSESSAFLDEPETGIRLGSHQVVHSLTCAFEVDFIDINS